MKRFGIFVLSLLVLYSGVAWAVEGCLDRENHAEHLLRENHHESASSLDFSHASEDSFSLVHCAVPRTRVGPAIRAATPKPERPIERLLPFRPDSNLGASIGVPSPGSLSSLNRILTFPFHAGIPRHIYLSVLHI